MFPGESPGSAGACREGPANHDPDPLTHRSPHITSLALETGVADITILGAGYMGSALTIPATDNGHRVGLWGTWLDDHLVEALQRGEPHPKLRLRLPRSVACTRTRSWPRRFAGQTWS